MPIYVYSCTKKKCKNQKELTHSMSECDTIQVICENDGYIMKRVPQEVQLMGFKNGTSVPEKVLLQDKQKQRKLRSKLQFKNEEIAKVKDPDSKRYFKKKYSTDPQLKNLKGDHEKIK